MRQDQDTRDYYAEKRDHDAERISRFGELLLDSAEAVDMGDDDLLILDDSHFEE